jgi:hypothetical protein
MFLLFITKYAQLSSVICSVAPFNHKIHQNDINYSVSASLENKLICMIMITCEGGLEQCMLFILRIIRNTQIHFVGRIQNFHIQPVDLSRWQRNGTCAETSSRLSSEWTNSCVSAVGGLSVDHWQPMRTHQFAPYVLVLDRLSSAFVWP